MNLCSQKHKQIQIQISMPRYIDITSSGRKSLEAAVHIDPNCRWVDLINPPMTHPPSWTFTCVVILRIHNKKFELNTIPSNLGSLLYSGICIVSCVRAQIRWKVLITRWLAKSSCCEFPRNRLIHGSVFETCELQCWLDSVVTSLNAAARCQL